MFLVRLPSFHLINLIGNSHCKCFLVFIKSAFLFIFSKQSLETPMLQFSSPSPGGSHQFPRCRILKYSSSHLTFLCLLTGLFRSFTFVVIIDVGDLSVPCYLSNLLLVSPFPLFMPSFELVEYCPCVHFISSVVLLYLQLFVLCLSFYFKIHILQLAINWYYYISIQMH